MDQKIDTGLDNRQIIRNMAFSIVSFLLNISINFFLTPYITSQLGSEAYGYVKLANDFANYATLLTLAINSMSSRFIMLNRNSGKVEEAKKYYSCTAIANAVTAGIIAIPSILIVVFVENIFAIPEHLLWQVKVTFSITFLNFIINLVFSIFGNCYYLTNRLEVDSLRNAQSKVINSAVVISLLLLFKANITFIVIGNLVSTVYCIVANLYFSKKFVPDMEISLRYFDIRKVKELITSGIWNSITKLSQMLTSGLSLLITNLWVSSQMMGYMSVAKTIPNIIISLNGTVSNAFSSNLMILYAENNMNGLKKAVKTSIKIMCVFVAIPNAILVSIGTEFFGLWVPEQPSQLLGVMAVLSVINSCVTGVIQPLYQVFTITNKIRQSSIVMIIYGFVSIIITFILLNTTGLGVYAILGVSVVLSVIVALGYHIPFSAIYLNLPWYTFYNEVIKSVIAFAIVTAVGFGIKYFFVFDSWVSWFSCAILTGCIGLFLNICIVLKTDERKVLFEKVKAKWGRHK